MVRRIGRYEITGKLGDGGFGSVYRGYDATVERVIAIKVLSSQGDADLISRFRAEAMTVGNLHHKNIVTVYEFGDDNGTPFLAMEYLDGVDLQQTINNKSRHKSLTLLEKLEIMSEAAQGLHCAHENGVVHRDVKPANIMLLKDGAVKIMDFGIARLTNTESTRLTQTGFMVGTVPYMAPEQFKSSEVDTLCDIWSYGVVLYEFLTGVHPFKADDPAGMMYRITMEEPASVNSLVPECPAALTVSLQRLLAKDRHNRIQSLDDFVLDVEPVMSSLAKTEIPTLLKRAERLIDEDNLDGAQSVIGRLLKLDRSSKDARKLREHLRDRARAHALRPKVEALLREAEERANSRDFAGAIEKLNSAMLLDPTSPALQSRLERLRGEEDRARRADQAIGRGRRSLNEGDLTDAFTYFSQALEIDPDNGDGPALLEEVKSAMHDREVRAQVQAGLAEANNLIFIQAYDDAIALLTDLSEKTNSDEQIVRRLLETRQLKQAQEIKDRLNAGINAGRELLKRGSYAQACQALEDLDRENPDNPAIEVLLTHARERLRAEKLANEIETLLAQARGEKTSGRFDQALQYVRRALELDPANAKAMTLQRVCLDEAQAHRDRARIDAALEDYRTLLKEDKLEEALSLIERLTEDHPGERRVADAKIEVLDRIMSREDEHQLKLQQGIHEAERLLAEAHPESATRLLENLTAQYPAEVALHDLLDRAHGLKAWQEEQARLSEGLSAAQELLKSGNFDQACRALEDLDRQYPQNAAVQVLLTYSRERLEAEKVTAQIGNLLAAAENEQASGRLEEALRYSVCVLELDPANNRGLALKRTLLELIQADKDNTTIHAGIENVKALLRQQELDQALAAVERLRTLFPRDSRVGEVNRAVAKEIQERAVWRDREIQSGLKEAERMLVEGRFEPATRLLENLTSRFPDETAVLGLLERARQLTREQAAQEEIRKNLAAVRELASRRAWDDAVALIGKLSEERPDCREYIEEGGNLQRLRQRDLELSAVEAALKNASLEQAISMAEAAVASYPGEPRATAALQTARNRRDLTDLVIYARRRLMNGDLDEAMQLVADGRKRFPDSPELREIGQEIQKAQGLNQSMREARIALQNRAFGEARTIAQAILATQPENDPARSFLGEIDAREQEYERRQTYDRGRAEAERHLRAQKFEDAIEKLGQLIRSFPADTGLQEDLQRVYAARDRNIRQEAYEKGRHEIEALWAQGKLDETILKIDSLLISFPGDAALIADLTAVRNAQLLRQERDRLDVIVGGLEELFRKGDAAGVRRGAKSLLQQHREPRAVELLEWAEKSLKQAREIRKKGNNKRSPFLWGGLVCAGLAAAIILFSTRHQQEERRAPAPSELAPPPPASLPPSQASPIKPASSSVPQPGILMRPRDLEFSWQTGTPFPAPRTIQVTATQDQAWSITATDSWLSLTQTAGKGAGSLSARINPARLVPGEYTSVAVLSWAEGKQTMPVRLRVTAPRPESATPAPQVSPSTAPPVDCTSYAGIVQGVLRWSGELAPKEKLTITGKGASPGNLTKDSDPLPGCPISIDLPQSVQLKLESLPSADNHFSKIELVNMSADPIRSIRISWSILRTEHSR